VQVDAMLIGRVAPRCSKQTVYAYQFYSTPVSNLTANYSHYTYYTYPNSAL